MGLGNINARRFLYFIPETERKNIIRIMRILYG